MGAPVNLAETKEFNTEWGSKKQDGPFRLWGVGVESWHSLKLPE